MLLRLVASLVLVAGLIAPSVARAWTRAQVREVHARLEIAASGQATVRLSLAVQVLAGWLERLELAGLDEDLRLASDSAEVVLESGVRVASQAVLQAGGLTLLFPRRELRRGLHQVHVQYAIDLASRAQPQPGGFSRVTWTLPGWETALSGAEIVAVGPDALRAVVEPETSVLVESDVEDGRRVVRFKRVHVPRASPWSVALELPSSALAGVAPRSAAKRAPAPAPASPRRTGLLLGSALGLLVAWGGRRTRARLAALGRVSRPWLLSLGLRADSRAATFRLPWWAFGALSSLSGACWQWWPGVALLGWAVLIVLGLERGAAPPAVALGRFEPLRAAQLCRLAAARRRERSGLRSIDPASWLGLALSLAALTALVLLPDAFAADDPWGLGVLCALLAWLASSRLWQPRSLAEQVELLQRAAGRARVAGCALSLLWYAAAQTRSQPRLRVVPRARYAGLLRIELLVDTRRAASPLVLSVLLEAGSPAARWLRALWPDALCERSGGGAREAFLRPVAELSRPLEELLEHFRRESQRAVESGERERAA